MKLTLNNTEYDVNFQKPTGRHTTTYCTLLRGPVGSKNEDKALAGIGNARKHGPDTTNLVVARTVAFGKALLAAGFNRDSALQAYQKLGIRYKEEYFNELFSDC